MDKPDIDFAFLYKKMMEGLPKERLKKTEVLFELRGELDKETDRGCCLMAAGFLEEELRELLATKLVGSKKLIDSMFEFNGPLGTFSARIKMSYALGLICKTALSDLEIIRKMRNDFAHKHQPINFATELLKKQVYKLKSHMYEIGVSEPRKVFTNCIVGLVAHIHNAIFYAPNFVELQDFPLPSKEVIQRSNKDPEGAAADILDRISKGLNPFSEEK